MDFKNYSEIIEGILNPKYYTSETDIPKLEQNIMKAAERTITLPVETEDYKKAINDIDLLSLGFKNERDAKVHVRQGESPSEKYISVTPSLTHLRLQTRIAFPQIDCPLMKYYVAFISTEFERIKTRAYHMPDIVNSNNQIAVYATKCFYRLTHLVQASKDIEFELTFKKGDRNRAEAFIVNYLHKFLCSSVSVYWDLLTTFSKNPGKKKHCVEMPHSILKTKNMKSFASLTLITDQPEHEINGSSQNNSRNKKSERHKIPWNGKLNQLTALIQDLKTIQFLDEDKDGMPVSKPYTLLDVPDRILIDFIYENFCDKHGKSFKKETIKTYFKPSHADKRAKGNERFDISRYE